MVFNFRRRVTKNENDEKIFSEHIRHTHSYRLRPKTWPTGIGEQNGRHLKSMTPPSGWDFNNYLHINPPLKVENPGKSLNLQLGVLLFSVFQPIWQTGVLLFSVFQANLSWFVTLFWTPKIAFSPCYTPKKLKIFAPAARQIFVPGFYYFPFFSQFFKPGSYYFPFFSKCFKPGF